MQSFLQLRFYKLNNITYKFAKQTLKKIHIYHKLISFLLTAKRATYASQGDDASVTAQLPGAKQLEYRDGSYFYRDIYFGMERFTGMETVYHLDQAVWGMSYGGGMLHISDREQIRTIYAFLREALRLGSE